LRRIQLKPQNAAYRWMLEKADDRPRAQRPRSQGESGRQPGPELWAIHADGWMLLLNGPHQRPAQIERILEALIRVLLDTRGNHAHNRWWRVERRWLPFQNGCDHTGGALPLEGAFAA